MEIDETPVLGGDLTAIARGVELADPSVRRSCVGLHRVSTLALVVLELAAGGTERIAQRDIGILVSVIGGMGMSDGDLCVGKGNVDADVIECSLMGMERERLDDDPATRNVPAEPGKSVSQRTDARLERGRGVHVPERNSQRNHSGFPWLNLATR